MKIQITRTCLFIAVLMVGLQSCGSYKTPILNHWDEATHDGIVHLKDCPVVCKDRTVFFEEHVYDVNASCCAYCQQKQSVQTAALK